MYGPVKILQLLVTSVLLVTGVHKHTHRYIKRCSLATYASKAVCIQSPGPKKGLRRDPGVLPLLARHGSQWIAGFQPSILVL